MPYDNVYSEKRTPGALRTVWRKFYGDTTAMIGLYGCAGLVLLCLFGSWFAPYGIDQQFLGYQLLPPSWSRYGEVSFFLGTDDLGRDVLSRLLSGAAPTVGGAFVVTLAATVCGLALGIFAGSTHGLRSAVLNHILDTLLSIPSLLLAIIVVAFAGPHLSHAMFAVWLAILPRIVRSVYSMVHDELERVCRRRPSGRRDHLQHPVVCRSAEYRRRAGHRDHPCAVDGDSRYCCARLPRPWRPVAVT